MKILNSIITLILIVNIHSLNAQDSTSQKEVNVLFIGEKMTYNNNMLPTLQKMLDESDLNIKIDSSVYINFTLPNHIEKMMVNEKPQYFATRKKYDASERTPTEIKLQEKKWDIVILEPLYKNILINEVRIFRVNKSIQKIKKLVNNPNCRFMIYGTTIPVVEYFVLGGYSGSQIDDSLEKDKIYKADGVGRYDKTMKTLNNKLNLLENENSMEVINIGSMVYEIMKTEKKLNYFEEYDEITETFQRIYPSESGAYFNACVFYKVLSGKSLLDLNYNGSIRKKEAKKIRNLVEKTIGNNGYK